MTFEVAEISRIENPARRECHTLVSLPSSRTSWITLTNVLDTSHSHEHGQVWNQLFSEPLSRPAWATLNPYVLFASREERIV